MGIFSKLAFWKRKDDFADLGMGKEPADLNLGADLGLPDMQQPQPTYRQPWQQPPPLQQPMQSYQSYQPTSPPGFQAQSSFSAPQFSTPQQDITSKNIELISSKLDALKAYLDNISQRLANLERIASGEEERKRW